MADASGNRAAGSDAHTVERRGAGGGRRMWEIEPRIGCEDAVPCAPHAAVNAHDVSGRLTRPPEVLLLGGGGGCVVTHHKTRDCACRLQGDVTCDAAAPPEAISSCIALSRSAAFGEASNCCIRLPFHWHTAVAAAPGQNSILLHSRRNSILLQPRGSQELGCNQSEAGGGHVECAGSI